MRSVTLKLAMTPSFMGRIATMFSGVRPTSPWLPYPRPIVVGLVDG
jgi:hypothetical protein